MKVEQSFEKKGLKRPGRGIEFRAYLSFLSNSDTDLSYLVM